MILNAFVVDESVGCPMGLTDRLEEQGVRPIVVASHPRSGTHLLIDTFRLNFPQCQSWKWWGERMDRLYLNVAALFCDACEITEKQAVAILCRSDRPLIKTHTTPDFARDIVDGPFRSATTIAFLDWLKTHGEIFYTYRDGRNVLCSFYEMQRRSEAECNVPFAEFIRQRPAGISRVRDWGEHVRGWMNQPNVFCISMEGLLAHPAVCLREIAEKLQLDYDCQTVRLPRLTRSVAHGRVHRLFSRRPESTAVIGPHPGKTDWHRYFSPADRQFFADETGDLLIKLGYEEDDRWITPAFDDEPRCPAGFFAAPRHGPPSASLSLAAEPAFA